MAPSSSSNCADACRARPSSISAISFLALAEVAKSPSGATPDRHFGLVVDDREAVRPLIEQAGGRILPGGFLDFLDPWDNRIEIVDYKSIQFTKAAAVLAAMGVDATKTEEAEQQLRDKGMLED